MHTLMVHSFKEYYAVLNIRMQHYFVLIWNNQQYEPKTCTHT